MLCILYSRGYKLKHMYIIYDQFSYAFLQYMRNLSIVNNFIFTSFFKHVNTYLHRRMIQLN